MGKKWNIYKQLKMMLENSGFRKHAYFRVTRDFTSIAYKVALITKDKIFYFQLQKDDILVDPAGTKISVGEWQELYEGGKIDNSTMFIPIMFMKEMRLKNEKKTV